MTNRNQISYKIEEKVCVAPITQEITPVRRTLGSYADERCFSIPSFNSKFAGKTLKDFWSEKRE